MAKQTQYQILSIVLCVTLHLVNHFRIQILKLKQCHHHYIRFLQYRVLLLMWHICSVCFRINCTTMLCEITFDLMKLVHLFQTLCVCVCVCARARACLTKLEIHIHLKLNYLLPVPHSWSGETNIV